MRASASPVFASAKELAKLIDGAALKAESDLEDMRTLFAEARQYGFWSVCVSPYFVRHAREELRGSGVRVSAVVGFPLGFTLGEVKLAEATRAVDLGADEIDMPMNVQAFKSGDMQTVFDETRLVANYCRQNGKLLKVILECCYLKDSEKAHAARIVEHAGADFIKTSTGFGTSGAKAEDVRLLRRVLKPSTGIKAAGGIGTVDDALTMVRAGASRIRPRPMTRT